MRMARAARVSISSEEEQVRQATETESSVAQLLLDRVDPSCTALGITADKLVGGLESPLDIPYTG